MCIGFMWKGSLARELQRVFCEKLLEASLMLTEPMPTGSRTDPPLAKAEPIRNGSNASIGGIYMVIMYLRIWVFLRY